jgi:nucleotide-binding universal stress UspA family protein
MANQVKQPPGSGEVILILTDFSAVTENAMLHGLEFAQALQYDICLLHVYNPAVGAILNKEDEALKKIHRELLNRKLKYEQRYTVSINPLIREGNLFKVVHSVATGLQPRLMVLGTHGKQGLQKLFGSYALRVVLDSPCPVLVVQEPPLEPGYRRVLMPVTSEVDDIQLVEWVMRLRKLVNPEIHLFQAIEGNPDRKKTAAAITSRITAVFKENNISYTMNIAESPNDFSDQVISRAETTRSDLVVTMTMPTADATGYDFSVWNERLMFNPRRIPVMFIDRTETAG